MYSKFTVLTVILTLGLIQFSVAKEEVDSSTSSSSTSTSSSRTTITITSLHGTVETELEPQDTTDGTEQSEPEPEQQDTTVGTERPEPEPQDTAVVFGTEAYFSRDDAYRKSTTVTLVSELITLLRIVKILLIFLLWKLIPLLQFVGILFLTMGANIFTLIGMSREPRWYRSILVKYKAAIMIGLYIVLPILMPFDNLEDLLYTNSMPLTRPPFDFF